MSTCAVWVDRLVSECKVRAQRVQRTCVDGANETRKKCDREEDQGYEKCDSREKKCKSWLPWPLDAICGAFKWVCKAWVWVSKWVCVAWSYIVEFVCRFWAVVVSAVCVIVSWVLKPVCLVWTSVTCFLTAIATGLGNLLFGWTKRGRRIKHIFVLMLENRSFDHMLGFSGLQGIDAATGLPTKAEDLIGITVSNSANNVAYSPHPTADLWLYGVDKDPGHEFDEIAEQLANNNGGFAANYASRQALNPGRVMNAFAPEKLPILNTLAREFAVCDHWFSSLPGPTWPNRLFVHAASSAGLDDSLSGGATAWATIVDGHRFDNGTIYDALDDKCLKWRIFHGDHFPQALSLSGMNYYYVTRFSPMSEFADAVSDPNYDAAYTFIEPHYGNILPWTDQDYTCGNSQHPLDDVTSGERLIKQVYETLRASPLWKSSLLIVTYDEHGGFYDHVIPGPTVHPGDSITDLDYNHHNFDFKRLGFRVPTIAISPYIKKGVIDHATYDHSSVIKTASEILGLRSLTNRDKQARSLTHLLTLKSPRADAPSTLPSPARSGFRCGEPGPPTGDADLGADEVVIDAAPRIDMRERFEKMHGSRPPEPNLRGVAFVALRQLMRTRPIAEWDDLAQRFKDIKTSLDARRFLQEAKESVATAAAGQPKGAGRD